MKNLVRVHLGKEWEFLVTIQTAEHMLCEARKFENDANASTWFLDTRRRAEYIDLATAWACFHGLPLPSLTAKRKSSFDLCHRSSWEELEPEEQAA